MTMTSDVSGCAMHGGAAGVDPAGFGSPDAGDAGDPVVPVLFGMSEPVSGVPLERLEQEMASLASHLAAATCAFLEMVGEYDARRGWASWQALSSAHWLNWRCGVGMVAAREQVRVARRLRELPAIREAFSVGALSYSKVRALTRVAHPAIDERLVQLAQHSTAAQLERYCAGLRRGQDQHREDARLAEGEERAIARRSLSWYRDPGTGDLIGRFRVPAGVETDSFLAQLRDATVVEAAQGDALENLECRRLDALVDLVAAGAATDASLRTQPVIVLHIDAEPDLPASAESRASAESPADTADRGSRADPRAPSGETRPWPIRLSSGAPLSGAMVAQLACDAGFRAVARHVRSEQAGDDQLDLGRHQRFPSRRLRRAILRRDDGCCRFPGCTRRHRLDVHHIVYWEHGGRTDCDNLLLLCPTHHRAVHHGGWAITGSAAGATFQRPDGRNAEPAPTPPGGTLAALVDANRTHGRDIALDGAGSRWLGDRIDWDCFFAAFNEGPFAPPLDAPSDRTG